jgi:hypothetical protein
MNEEQRPVDPEDTWIEDPAENLAESGGTPSPSDEDVLRAKAREAIQAGRLPNRCPDQTWGGPGSGACCTVCGVPVRSDEFELELEFAPAGESPGPRKHPTHPRCFGALMQELRPALPGSIDGDKIAGSVSPTTFDRASA